MMPSRDTFRPPRLPHRWLWRYSCCFHAHAHAKGHNGLCPCPRMCSIIIAIRIPDSRNKTLYVPLSPPQSIPCTTDVVEYRPENFTAALARSVYGTGQSSGVRAHRSTARGAAKTYGIKGTPLLSALGSLRFPQSAPYDFYAFDLGKSYPETLSSSGSGHYKGMDLGQPYVPKSTYLAGCRYYIRGSY